MGVTVRRATVDDWPEVRDLRLAALQDTPDAFGATYEQEAAFRPEDWQGRLSQPDAATYLASLAAGYTRLVLDVADGNPHAQALYARHGFVRTGRTGTLPPPRTHVTEHQLAREVP